MCLQAGFNSVRHFMPCSYVTHVALYLSSLLIFSWLLWEKILMVALMGHTGSSAVPNLDQSIHERRFSCTQLNNMVNQGCKHLWARFVFSSQMSHRCTGTGAVHGADGWPAGAAEHAQLGRRVGLVHGRRVLLRAARLPLRRLLPPHLSARWRAGNQLLLRTHGQRPPLPRRHAPLLPLGLYASSASHLAFASPVTRCRSVEPLDHRLLPQAVSGTHATLRQRPVLPEGLPGLALPGWSTWNYMSRYPHRL